MAVYFVAERNLPSPRICRNARAWVLTCERAKPPCHGRVIRYPQLRKPEAARGMGIFAAYFYSILAGDWPRPALAATIGNTPSVRQNWQKNPHCPRISPG